MQNDSKLGDAAAKGAGSESGPADTQKTGEHAYLISIEKLIVHKYAEREALLRKADKLARELIQEELREGEFVRVVNPGRYFLHFPKLRSDARELRGSIITEKIYRAIRDLNPAAKQLHESIRNGVSDETGPVTARPAPKPMATPTRHVPSRATNGGHNAEMKKLSSSAMAAMAGAGVVLQEELLQSPLGAELAAKMTVTLAPIWFAPKNVIIGHDCMPTYNEAPVCEPDKILGDFSSSTTEIRAILDTITYGQTCDVLEKRLANKAVGLVICPVHASTLLHAKYRSAFLAAGSNLSDHAKNYLIFVVKDFTHPISRIKVRDVAGYLRPRARALLVELPLETDDIPGFFKEYGFYGARARVSRHASSEAVAIKQLDTFAEGCETAKLQSTIDGLATKSLAVAAAAAGFHHLSGPAIHVEHDSDLQKFDAEALFR
jgi:hypothetical protein